MNSKTRGDCLLKCNLVCMQMCLQRLRISALINSESVPSNFAQSLLLIKISHSRCLSESRLQNSICVHICSYQSLHLCWIYVSACQCVLFACCCVDIHRCRHRWLSVQHSPGKTSFRTPSRASFDTCFYSKMLDFMDIFKNLCALIQTRST